MTNFRVIDGRLLTIPEFEVLGETERSSFALVPFLDLGKC